VTDFWDRDREEQRCSRSGRVDEREGVWVGGSRRGILEVTAVTLIFSVK
jgi:hypothetical protein